jgi:hypothetical protein
MLRGANTSEENMRFTLAIFYLLASAMSALAQSGVSTQRDMYGNLVRSTGTYSPRGINQGPVNNGPIISAPARPQTSNSRLGTGINK